MKFYIASRLKNHEQVKYLSEKLKAAGWTHTYDWTAHGSVKESSTERLAEIGQKELDGVKDADIVIVLTPQGGGTHTELGFALAFGKAVYLCHSDDTYFKCNDDTSTFYWLPQVQRFVGNIDELVAKLLSNECKAL